MTLEELVDKYIDWVEHAGSDLERAVMEEVLEDVKKCLANSSA